MKRFKPRLHSNADMFERKGNPWHGEGRQITRRPNEEVTEEKRLNNLLRTAEEGGAKYAAEIRARHRDEENPDFDQFAKARKATPRVGIPPVHRQPKEATASRKLANAFRSLNSTLNKSKEIGKEVNRAADKREAFDSARNMRAFEEDRLAAAKKRNRPILSVNFDRRKEK